MKVFNPLRSEVQDKLTKNVQMYEFCTELMTGIDWQNWQKMPAEAELSQREKKSADITPEQNES